MFATVLRAALALGVVIDGGVGLVAMFAQPLIQPLSDIPVRDPTITRLAGAEFIVVACVYALAFRDPVRWRPLLWLCALDQTFAVILPAIEIAHGAFPATIKTVGPIPLSVLLVVIYVVGAVRPVSKRSATPFMQ